MKFPRRTFLHLAAGAAALPVVLRIAWAQAYPTRPVRIIVGFGAGFSPDIVARLVGQRLSERLGQQFVVENRPGAASNLATEAVVRAPPDGYTLLLANGANAVSATLYEKLSFDFIRDIAPVASIAGAALVMVTNLSFPAKTVPEFIAYAKANPGKINMAVAGGGASTPFLAGDMSDGFLNLRAGPGTRYAVKARLVTGDVIWVGAPTNGWTRVSVPRFRSDGKDFTGWVWNKHVVVDAEQSCHTP